MTRKSPNPVDVLAQWIERDLTLLSSRDELRRAYMVDGIVEQVCGLLDAGRTPVLVGESGVGKSAIVTELATRVHLGRAPRSLVGRRLIQISFANRMSALKQTDQLRPEFQKLVELLLRRETDVVPFFRDLHMAYSLSVEPQLHTLLLRLGSPVLAESTQDGLERILEYQPELKEFLVPLFVAEPTLDRTREILVRAAADAPLNGFPEYDESAVDAAISVTHRFLAREQMPRKAIDLIQQAAALQGAGGRATVSSVIDWFCRCHQVPKALVDPTIALDIGELRGRFQSRLLGQGEAVEALVNLVAIVKAGLADIRRPFGVFLFVGPTGVGKTHAAQLLAEYLFGDRDRLVRINIADYQDDGAHLRLFGDPGGQNQTQMRGVLTSKITTRPFGVLLLDELEKATTKVHDGLLQLFDEGTLVNGAGETISCRSMVIIATSNAGAELHRGHAFGLAKSRPGNDLAQELEQRLETVFRFEFLNRFDRIVHFHPLTRADIRTIAVRELEALTRREGLRQRKLSLECDESVVDWLTVHGYDPANGARFLRRTIERHVTGALAEAVVREQTPGGSRIHLSVRGNRIVARGGLGSSVPGARVVSDGLVHGTSKVSGRVEVDRLAETIAREAQPLLEALERQRSERSELLELMNEAGFWTADPENRQRLERFRELDVSVRAGERLARPITTLGEMRARGGELARDYERLSRAVEAASAALRDWQMRSDEESGGSLWVAVFAADPLSSDSSWIEQVAGMYVGWCARCHLVAEIAALEFDGQSLNRVVIGVEGPAAARLMKQEAGVHRLRQARSRDARARVMVYARSDHPSGSPETLPMRAVKGPLGVQARASCGLSLPGMGLKVRFVGPEFRMLAHAVGDLAVALGDTELREDDTVRVYGESGGLARDPRTGMSARLKDVLKGDLAAFAQVGQ